MGTDRRATRVAKIPTYYGHRVRQRQSSIAHDFRNHQHAHRLKCSYVRTLLRNASNLHARTYLPTESFVLYVVIPLVSKDIQIIYIITRLGVLYPCLSVLNRLGVLLFIFVHRWHRGRRSKLAQIVCGTKRGAFIHRAPSSCLLRATRSFHTPIGSNKFQPMEVREPHAERR